MSTSTAPVFNPATVGQWGDPQEFAVERERIQAYAAATNDPIEPHVAGEFASPVFGVVPAFQAVAGESMKVIPGELIGAIVHGEQDMRFHAPIVPGMTLRTRGKVIGIEQRSSGVIVGMVGESRDAATDGLVIEQYMSTFVRGAQTDAVTGEGMPEHPFDESLRERGPDAEVSQTFDADQTYRYAEASGDPMPIHLDDDFAKAVGLPGIIIHGLCTMAFTSVAVIQHACPEDPQRLKRLAVRFSKMAFPEETITTRIWHSGETDGRDIYSFETTNASGAPVIRDGLAEVDRG